MATSADSPRLSETPQRPTIPRPVVAATPAYSLVSEKLRRVSSGSLQCALFCGGARCKYEVAHRWKKTEKALEGLFSHWVTEDILAMARPSTVLFREHALIDQFKRSVHIKNIIICNSHYIKNYFSMLDWTNIA